MATKNKPQVYPKDEFSLFAEKLIKEGYKVFVICSLLLHITYLQG